MYKNLARVCFLIAFIMILSGVWSLTPDEAMKCIVSGVLFVMVGWIFFIIQLEL